MSAVTVPAEFVRFFAGDVDYHLYGEVDALSHRVVEKSTFLQDLERVNHLTGLLDELGWWGEESEAEAIPLESDELPGILKMAQRTSYEGLSDIANGRMKGMLRERTAYAGWLTDQLVALGLPIADEPAPDLVDPDA